LQHVQARRRAAAGGVEQHHLAREVPGEAGQQVGDRVAFGVDEHRAPPGFGVGQELGDDQGGLPGAGRADDPHVVAGVGHGDGHRAGCPGVSGPQRPGRGAGNRDRRGRGDGAGSGAGKARDRRVGGQMGEAG